MSRPVIDKEQLEILHKVGDIVHEVLKLALQITRPGIRILDLCETLENRIRNLGAKPAFPVNVCVNHIAAHYTATIDDTSTIPEGSVVKVDVGAHIDGYIVDAAVTIAFNPVYDNLLKASLQALKTVKDVLKPGVSLGKIGGYIEKTIRAFGFKPIENLTGHLIRRYELHAGKSIPNIDNGDERKVLEGEIYAIEPFATNGEGIVVDTPTVTIFRLLTVPRKKLSKEAQQYVDLIESEQDHLPFSPRWFRDKVQDVNKMLETLRRENALYEYPVLVERKKGMVAQFEDTFVVTSTGAIELARTLELVR